MDQIVSRRSLNKNGIDAAIAVAAKILPRSNMGPPVVGYEPEPCATVWMPVMMNTPYPDVVGTVIWANACSTDVAVGGRLVYVISTRAEGQCSRAIGVWNRTPIQQSNGIWYIQLVAGGVCLLETAQIRAVVGDKTYPGMTFSIGDLKFVMLQPDTVESKVFIVS